jgi:DNA-binding CsgD family transcriptional regulator
VAKREAIPESEMRVYRRMSHHLAAAYRCRRRLRQAQPVGAIDPTCDAEAVLDAKARVVHAVGSAREKGAQEALVATAKARDRAHTTRVDPLDELDRWSPLTSARWSLVDSFERSGHRYVVARENRARVAGLEALSDRERQVVAYLAMGQSTKETAYALGISDVTVRVLLARAATKLGVKSRSGLLAYPEVQSLVTGSHRS